MSEEKVTAENKPDKYKNYALLFFIALSLILIYVLRERFKVTINGAQILTGIAIIVGALYLYFRQTKPVVLPPAHVIAKEIATWYWTNHYGVIDYLEFEVNELSESQTLMFFPSVAKTFTYKAGLGVVGVEYKDLEQSIRVAEERGITKRLIERQAKSENLVSTLERKGFEVST